MYKKTKTKVQNSIKKGKLIAKNFLKDCVQTKDTKQKRKMYWKVCKVSIYLRFFKAEFLFVIDNEIQSVLFPIFLTS